MDKLVSKISHEMGNAVTVVRCSLNILKIQYPQVGDTKYFDTVLGEIGYMESLIKDISTYNNLQLWEKNKNDIYTLVEKVVDSVKDIYIERGIHIKVITESVNEDYSIECDSTKMIQVFINLIKNAVEAIGENGFIDIRISKRGNFVHIDISDDGCGIREEYISGIFEPMVTHKENGTGMGLAIVKEIVENHKGKIKVASELNSGTTFTITFPIYQG